MAPVTPPNFTDRSRGGATAKPKANRKWGTHSQQSSLQFLSQVWQFSFLDDSKLPCVSPGEDKVIARTKSEKGKESRGKSSPTSVSSLLSMHLQWRLYKKNAAETEFMQGEISSTCLQCTWKARYPLSTAWTTSVPSLHRMSRVALYLYTYIHAGLTAGCRYLDHIYHMTVKWVGSSFTPQQERRPCNQNARGNPDASQNPYKISRAGPKSGDIRSRPMDVIMFSVLVFLDQITQITAVNVDVRVASGSMPLSGAPQGAKPNGTREASKPTVATLNFNTARVNKRTYRRAYARSVRQGGAFYRGQWRESTWFQPTSVRPVYLHKRRTETSKDKKHFRVLSWNAGGLSPSVFQEL